MPLHKFLIILLALLIGACCKKSKQTGTYTLSTFEQQCIPYVENTLVKFKHSNGFEFDVKVDKRQSNFLKSEVQHCGDNYAIYESLSVLLSCSNPDLNINLEILPKNYRPIFTISINNYGFYINTDAVPTIDTLVINGKEYYNIYEINAQVMDSTVIRPRQVLYNKVNGIIQITMTHDEKFTINE